MAAIAETYYVSLAPHNPSGPVATAATLSIAASTPIFRILELFVTDVTWRREISDERIVFHDGLIDIPEGEGLGITLNEEACASPPFQSVDLRHYRGRLTNIRPKDGTIIVFDGYEGREKELVRR